MLLFTQLGAKHGALRPGGQPEKSTIVVKLPFCSDASVREELSTHHRAVEQIFADKGQEWHRFYVALWYRGKS